MPHITDNHNSTMKIIKNFLKGICYMKRQTQKIMIIAYVDGLFIAADSFLLMLHQVINIWYASLA